LPRTHASSFAALLRRVGAARVGKAVNRAWPAVVPEQAALGEHLVVVHGQPHERVRAVGGRAQQRPHHAPEHGQRARHPRRVGPARVHGVHHDAVGAQALGVQLGERHLRALGPRVGLHAVVVGGRHLQLGHGERLAVHAARGHPQHARALRRTQRGQQQLGEQHGAHHLARHRELGALGALLAHVVERAGVVDEHVDLRVEHAQLRGGALQRREVPRVGHELVDVRVAGAGAQLGAGAGQLAGVAPDERERGPHAREAAGGLEPEARRGARDHDDAAREVRALERVPVVEPPAHGRAHAREAAADAPLERRVHAVGHAARAAHATTSVPRRALRMPAAARSPMRPKARRSSGSNSPSGPRSVRMAS
jgi:hypothetical protein